MTWQNGAVYTERWKGPYSAMKNISANGGNVLGRKLVVGALLTSASQSSWRSIQGLGGVPPTIPKMKWVIDSITATEMEAGRHGILEITARAIPEDEEIGGYGSSISAEESAELCTEVVTENSGWTLRWATYSRSPLEYCTKEPNAYTGIAGEDSKVAHADCVIRCSQLPKPRESQIPQPMSDKQTYPRQYLWVEQNASSESLSVDVKTLHNEREKKIYDWYSRGMQPVFHYPILTFSQTWEWPLSCADEFRLNGELGLLPVGAETVDYVCEWNNDPNLEECPFALDEGWHWIDCGTECTTRRSNGATKGSFQVTWTTTWEGCREYVEEWYGDDDKRWIPGAYADTNQVPGTQGGQN